MTDDQKLEPWKELGHEQVFSCPWYRIVRHDLESPAKKKTYFVHEGPDVVMIVCLTPEGQVIMERQYRFPIRAVDLGYPAGFIDEGETPEQAIARELGEETGYAAKRIEPLVTVHTHPGLSATKSHVFVGYDAEPIGTDIDEDELVVPVLMRPEEIVNAIRSEELSCSHCVAVTFHAAKKLGWVL